MGKAAKAAHAAVQQQPPQHAVQQEHPSLPPLKLSPKKLRVQEVNDHMLLVPGVLSIPECQQLIDAAEGCGFEHQSSRGPAYGEAFRDNHRISMQDERLADQLWHTAGLDRVMQGVEVDGLVPVGLNPHIRFYRYSVGQKFGRHIDDSVEVQPGQITGYTLLVYLSGTPQQAGPIDTAPPPKTNSSSSSSQPGGSKSKRQKPTPAAAVSTQPVQVNTNALQQLVGGETVFYGARGRVVASVRPAVGLALLHLHGEDKCLEHEGNVVQQGIKYVLRSDVVFAAPGDT